MALDADVLPYPVGVLIRRRFPHKDDAGLQICLLRIYHALTAAEGRLEGAAYWLGEYVQRPDAIPPSGLALRMIGTG